MRILEPFPLRLCPWWAVVFRALSRQMVLWSTLRLCGIRARGRSFFISTCHLFAYVPTSIQNSSSQIVFSFLRPCRPFSLCVIKPFTLIAPAILLPLMLHLYYRCRHSYYFVTVLVARNRAGVTFNSLHTNFHHFIFQFFSCTSIRDDSIIRVVIVWILIHIPINKTNAATYIIVTETTLYNLTLIIISNAITQDVSQIHIAIDLISGKLVTFISVSILFNIAMFPLTSASRSTFLSRTIQYTCNYVLVNFIIK